MLEYQGCNKRVMSHAAKVVVFVFPNATQKIKTCSFFNCILQFSIYKHSALKN